MKLENFKKHVQEASTSAILDTLNKLNTQLIATDQNFASIIFEELENRTLTEAEKEKFYRLKDSIIIDHKKNKENIDETSSLLFDIITNNQKKSTFLYFSIYGIKITAILFLLIWIPITIDNSHHNNLLMFTGIFVVFVLFLLLLAFSYLLEYTVKSHSTLQQLLKDRDQ